MYQINCYFDGVKFEQNESSEIHPALYYDQNMVSFTNNAVAWASQLINFFWFFMFEIDRYCLYITSFSHEERCANRN